MHFAWKTLGRAWQVGAVIVHYPDGPVICGRVPEAPKRSAVERLMERLPLPPDATKTRSMRAGEEPLEFLPQRATQLHPSTGKAYVGTRPRLKIDP